MNVSISEISWHGQHAWLFENDIIQTVVVPELGAKLVSLYDRRTEREWLVGTGDRGLKKVAYGASFVEQDMSGWDEMFPTIVACDYPAPGIRLGTPLPDHGEVWFLPWTFQQTNPDALSFSVEGIALRYRLTRTLTYRDADTLQLQYALENLELENMPFLWAAHPQFICGDAAKIRLPAQVTEVCNTIPAAWGWGEPETKFSWPEAVSVGGKQVSIDHVGSASLRQARKFFVLPEVSVRWAGLIRQPANDWLRLDWDPVQVPYLGLWVDEGKLSRKSVVAIEPMTGFFDSLAIAWEKKRVTMIEPGEIKTWTLSVRLGTGNESFPVEDRLPSD